MKVLKYGKINDMPRGWISKEKWHHVIYDMWSDMWRRCYTKLSWFGCQIQPRYKYLSNYVNDIMKLENFDKFKENPKGWCIDKDIKFKDNRDYYFEALSLITRSENCTDANNRRDYSNWYNHPMKNSLTSKRSGKSRIKPVIGINSLNILLYKSLKHASENNLHPGNISSCCTKKLNSYLGYKWYYINYKHGKVLRRVH